MKSLNLEVRDVFSSASHKSPIDICSTDLVRTWTLKQEGESFARESPYAKRIVGVRLIMKKYKSQMMKELLKLLRLNLRNKF